MSKIYKIKLHCPKCDYGPMVWASYNFPREDVLLSCPGCGKETVFTPDSPKLVVAQNVDA